MMLVKIPLLINRKFGLRNCLTIYQKNIDFSHQPKNLNDGLTITNNLKFNFTEQCGKMIFYQSKLNINQMLNNFNDLFNCIFQFKPK